MHVAVVGAGVSGLGTAYHLLRLGHQVTVYDGGKGASHIASGLLHPYVGKDVKKSWLSDPSMSATLELIREAEEVLGLPVCDRSGIERRLLSDEKKERLLKEPGVVECEGGVLFKEGITVYTELYLEGLKKACHRATFIQKKVDVKNIEADHIVLATGYSIKETSFVEGVKMSYTKGQTLVMEGKAPERSMIGTGYIAKTNQDHIFCAGSTYEHHFETTEPDIEVAKKEILKRTQTFYPEVMRAKVRDVKSGVRVSRKGHYYPFVSRIKSNLWVITGMGSRGLLYHAYLGHLLAVSIDENAPEKLPDEVRG